MFLHSIQGKTILNQLLESKNFSQMFEFLDIILNYCDLNKIGNNFNQAFKTFVSFFNNYTENNKKLLRDFSRGLVVFCAKIVVKINSEALASVLGESFGFIISELCDYLTDLDNNKNKKIVTYAYCMIMTDYYKLFTHEQLKFFTHKLITHLEKFNKVLGFNAERLLDTEICYNSNTYNKLMNADIKVYTTKLGRCSSV
jgi:hypothetical protein